MLPNWSSLSPGQIQNGSLNSSTHLLRTPKPIRRMALRFRSDRGGSNAMLPCFSTPRGTVTRTQSAA